MPSVWRRSGAEALIFVPPLYKAKVATDVDLKQKIQGARPPLRERPSICPKVPPRRICRVPEYRGSAAHCPQLRN
jgi:hypothetical protein